LKRPIHTDDAMPDFDTERLRMRHLVENDEALYCDLYTDPDTMRYIGEPMSPERAARSFRKALAWSRQQPDEPQFFAIQEKATQQAIGLCAIQPFDADTRKVEIGMMLKPEARKQGYATEGLAALVTTAFSALPTEAVWVQYSPEHTAAERLVISVGFAQCADGEIGTVRGAKCVWSVGRSSWRSSNTTNHLGEDDVERDRVS
jgi:RimJ/RimL family protein N-acetyltransferase